ncbi:MAG: polyphenol oxidase family protein [Candidatus Syntrophosphaera sp.]
MKTFFHLGNIEPDYRSIMREHTGIRLGEKKIPARKLVIAEQIHSDHVHVCSEADFGAGFGDHPQIPGADALLTNIPGQYLLIRTADCFPILLLDSNAGAVGAVHSGREGTRKNIAGRVVRHMESEYGVFPRDTIAWIGPGICGHHYEVGGKVWEEFNQSMQDSGFEPSRSAERRLDLRARISAQLIAAGIPPENIRQQNICTYESPEHFSFRKNGTHNRQINLVGIEYE